MTKRVERIVPYEVVLTMRRSTAECIKNHLTRVVGRRHPLVRQVISGFRVGKARGTLRLPYDHELLGRLRDELWGLVTESSIRYGVAEALERLVTEIDEVRRTSVVDHLVRYTDRLDRLARS